MTFALLSIFAAIGAAALLLVALIVFALIALTRVLTGRKAWGK